MKTGPRYKIAKRLGVSVFEKAQTQKFAVSEARSAKNKKGGGRRGRSEFGRQMLEKQKVRVTYGVTERQFRNYVREALTAAGTNPTDRLHEFLELRLDNVAYRLGLAPTRRAARQMVAHGHLMVNGKKVRVPSHRVYVADRIAIREGSRPHAFLTNFNEKFLERPLPSWLSWNPKDMEGGVAERPTQAVVGTAGDLSAVLSFYTR